MKLHKNLLLSLVAFFSLLAGGFIAADNSQAATTDDDAPSYSSIYKLAKKNLGKPYVYGATGPYAFDCSGFTSYVYKKAAKVTIPRTAAAQYQAAKKVSYKNMKKGDLVFFGYSAYSIYHVGVYVGNGQMIDAQNNGVVKEKVIAPWWDYYGSARVTNLK
ncbi:NlpC/P60 family protein [Lentilactobacillus senioris]|uniref:C40 family peptidase n=1 Tax=Lentilactobacillus senioris TaxID=931534 RepID=UPI00227F057B|nr:NlpC/P60 family protein [Lentilactobacillus senioris]MCY9806309.1 NlpC/P60 family protein [Lentilactobacillus senioris]